MNIYRLSLMVFSILVGISSHAEVMPKGATPIGPTILMSQDKSESANISLVQHYIANQNHCDIVENNGKTSTFVKCKNQESVALVNLPFQNTGLLLLRNGFNEKSTDAFFSYGETLRRVQFQK